MSGENNFTTNYFNISVTDWSNKFYIDPKTSFCIVSIFMLNIVYWALNLTNANKVWYNVLKIKSWILKIVKWYRDSKFKWG